MTNKKPDFFNFFMHSGLVSGNKNDAKYSETFHYWLFRYGDYIYKVLKKPVKEENMAIESHYMNKIQLSSEILSPELNFEVWALEKNDDTYNLVPFEDSEGTITYFAFKMKYLSPAKLLSAAIDKKKIVFNSLKLVCENLYSFHERADSISDNYTGTYDHLHKIFDDLVFQSKKYLHKTFSHAVINMTCVPVQRYLSGHKRLLFARMKNNKIREIHRCFIPSKIFIDKSKAVFIPMHNDSISHNYSDVACDVADLALSLVLADQKELADKFVNYYYEISGDNEMAEVMPFYMVLKAYQRGLYESLKLSTTTENKEDEEKILMRATTYYDKAALLATELSNIVTHKNRNRKTAE